MSTLTVGARCASNFDGLMKWIHPLDDGFNAFLIIFSIGLYIATYLHAARAALIFQTTVAGFAVAKTFFTILKCADGLFGIARGKTHKDPAMKAVAQVAFTAARVALCLFALQKINLIKLHAHASWLNSIVVAGFGAGTILYFAHAMKKMYCEPKPEDPQERKDLRRDVISGVLNAVAMPFELEVLSSDAPLALKVVVAVFAVFAAIFDSVRGLCCSNEKPKSTQPPIDGRHLQPIDESMPELALTPAGA